MRKLREIERLRGIAIVLAMFNHPPLHDFTPRFCGVVGVHLFFVISGFVISRSLLRLLPARGVSAIPALKIFFVRRFFRIVPLALVSMTLVLTASIFYNSAKVWSSPGMIFQEIGLICTLLYNHTMLSLGPDLFFFWSLNVEEHFYLVLPALLVAVRAPRVRLAGAVAVVLAVALVLRPLTAPASLEAGLLWKYHFSTLPRLDTLMAGVLLGLISHERLFKRPRATTWLKLGGKALALAALAVLLFNHRVFTVADQTGWTLVLVDSIILVYMASLQRGLILSTPVVAEVFEYLGSRSYALYLVHLPLWKIFLEFQARHPSVATYSHPVELAAYYALASVVAAELAHRWVELPLIHFGKAVAVRLQTTQNQLAVPIREAA